MIKRIRCMMTDHAPEGFGLNSVLFLKFKIGTAIMTICDFCGGEMEWYPPEADDE